MTQLSPQQQRAIEEIKNWYQDAAAMGSSGPFRLFGAAGTGKTTIAKEIAPALGITNVRFGTFTGKAAHVLRTKGADPVSTIHSGIYFPTTSEEAKERLRLAQVELSELSSVKPIDIDHQRETDEAITRLEAEIQVLTQEARRLSWEWNPESEWASADLIVLDEVSMVNAKLAADIEAYDVPVLVLGDPAQLPPVDGGGYYTNAKPDFELTEVHRQALESPVLAMATRVRLSTDARLGVQQDELVPVSLSEAMDHDQILTWSNPRRWAIIDAYRRKAGREAGTPVAGDRIMCLTNNKDLAVFNGQQFEVLASTPATLGPTLTVRTEEGQERQIPTYADAFMGQTMQEQAKNSGAGLKGGRMLATFAQAITCHKAQGSEWRSVYVVNELPNMMGMTAKREGQAAATTQARRWLYTAITRASDQVTVTAPTGRR